MTVLPEIFDLTGRVALLTGASKGIGKAMARILAEAGATVIISSRKQDAVEEAAEEFRQAGLKALGMAVHMGQPETFPALIGKIVETHGRIDVLVNNAATNPVYGPILEQDAAAFDKIMSVNVKGPLEMAKLVHPHMAAAGGGSVINISSVGGIKPIPDLGLYSISKAALIQMTKLCAKEWGPDGIRVNAVCPGLIKTKFSRALWDNDQARDHWLANMPIKRVGDPRDLMGIALWLASDAGAFATGGVYTVDGGETI